MRHGRRASPPKNFPKTVKLGGADCSASYLHSPGDARDGITVTVPLFVLNQVSEGARRVAGARHAERENSGALEKPAAAPAQPLCAAARKRRAPGSAVHGERALGRSHGQGQADRHLLKRVRVKPRSMSSAPTSNSDMLSPHLFMNFRVTDEHGRSNWGMQPGGVPLRGSDRAESKARGAFQALAG